MINKFEILDVRKVSQSGFNLNYHELNSELFDLFADINRSQTSLFNHHYIL